MLTAIPDVLDTATLARIMEIIRSAEWTDGNITSGHQSALAKRNRQLPEESAAAQEAGRLILEALARIPLFIAAALPSRIFPPLFNAYGPGDQFATHVDNAVRIRRFDDFRIRSDLSATIFLVDPASYDGGELVVEDRFGTHKVKLPAGHMVLYPASSLHHVTPVTRGERMASFFWIQSMVRDDAARNILLDLDTAVQDVAADRGNADRTVITLTGVYHNLLRRWAEL